MEAPCGYESHAGMREFISLNSIYKLLSVSKQSKSETLTPAGFFFYCSKNIESESYPFNKVLSLQHTILNYSYDVEQQISRTSFCTTEISYLWFSSYHFPLCPAPATTALISASMSTRLLDTTHEWNHAVFDLLGSTQFTQHDVLQLPPFCHILQDLPPF